MYPPQDRFIFMNLFTKKKGGAVQRSVNKLVGSTMQTLDGKMGKVKALFFDDEAWTIRYLVLETEDWLQGRKVLISPEALIKNRWRPGAFVVDLTSEQIRDSPHVDTSQPVSRRQERELYEYYSWPAYWATGVSAGGMWGTGVPAEDKDIQGGDELHLQSSHRMADYDIHASDGEIGQITDFILDDHTWQLQYLVVRTHTGFGGKCILLKIHHIKEVKWNNFEVVMDIASDTIKASPAFG